MSLQSWFKARRKLAAKQLRAAGMDRVSDEQVKALWQQCYSCNTQLSKKQLAENLHVCPECGYHFRINAKTRLEQLCDDFLELDEDLRPGDPLEFSDTQPYAKRKEDAERKSGLNDAIITGLARLGEEQVAIGVMDFAYMGGSMGSVVGEKITRLVERALHEQLPVIIVTSSGGARMQEGMFSLMQMVKTSAALGRLHESGLFYTTVLTEPTFGGVTASYGTLGDLIIAEKGARVGFAGRRVIEQTIRQKLPADFQTANYLMQYGQVDMVLKRHELKSSLERLIGLHRKASGLHPLLPPSLSDAAGVLSA